MGSRVVVGVVVAVPEPHASVLAGWRRHIDGNEGVAIPPHVTLLPPTVLDLHNIDEVELHLERAATNVAPFTIRLSGTGTFRPLSQVVFVQVSAGIAQCELLERLVRRGPVVRETEFPYHPHVTVGHDVADESLDAAFVGLRDFVAQFTVDEFVMHVQDDDGVWRIRRRFALTGPKPDVAR
jgi:2'-5' RNA ligase